MKLQIVRLQLEKRAMTLASAAILAAALAFSQTPAPAAKAKANAGGANKIRRTADGHPDLSGNWYFAIDLPHGDFVKYENGKVVERNHFDQSARHAIHDDVPGALPWDKAPTYKPEYREKVDYLFKNESKTDPVFYCDKPGTPRIGSPRKIIQLPKETVFLYEDISGDTFRVIPTDGRPHNAKANPSAFGDSIGRWEKDVFIVDTVNFQDDTWFGENGYMHTDKMHVIERLWLLPDGNLAYQATVEDPMLVKPWTNFAHVIPPNDDPISESPVCREDDGQRLQNLDHHLQR
jgi:hypothetical protein